MRRRRKLAKTSARGYGSEHKRARAAYAWMVERGIQPCRRCRLLIPPGGHGRCPKCGRNHGGWDMGHDDRDRSLPTAPEHVCCNRATAGRRKGLRASVQRALRRTTREW